MGKKISKQTVKKTFPRSERYKNISEDQQLTERQKKFCEEYVVSMNGAESAIKAGYSPRTANGQARDNLSKPHVQKYIRELKEKIGDKATMDEKQTIATARDVMEYFTKVMNGELKDQFGLEAPLAERTKAAIELARRTVDLENRLNGKADSVLQIKLDWSRD